MDIDYADFVEVLEEEHWLETEASQQERAFYEAQRLQAEQEEAMEAEYQSRLAEEAALRAWYQFGAGPC